jgi:hypothetical protein
VINVDRLEGVSKRVLRVLFASVTLAAAWVAIDLVAHTAPASAAEVIDVLPNVDEPVIPVVVAIVDPIVELAAPVAAPVVSAIAEPVEPVLAPVRALVDEVAAPIATTVIDPIVDDLVIPIAQTLPLEQLVPVAQVLVPAVQSALSLAQVPATTWLGRGMILGGGLLLGGALVSAIALPLPAPNGGQRRVPLDPGLPTGAFAGLFAPLGELNSGLPMVFGALRTAAPGAVTLPASPTYASDTTPD